MPVDPEPKDKAMQPAPAKTPAFRPNLFQEEGGRAAYEKQDGSEAQALANHELDEQTTLARPPLGN